MKTITLMLCCVFLAGCVSVVEPARPDPGRLVPRGLEPSPAESAYARAHRHSIGVQNTLDQYDTLAARAARSRLAHMNYSDAGLAAKYDPSLHYTHRYAREMMNMSQAGRARAEIDAYRRIRSHTGWAATHHSSMAQYRLILGKKLER